MAKGRGASRASPGCAGKVLTEKDFTDADYVGVSGHLGHISEGAAIQRTLRELKTNFDAVVSLGGESFLVYIVVNGRIGDSHGTCRVHAAQNWTRPRGAEMRRA
jgi:hypothetical protein